MEAKKLTKIVKMVTTKIIRKRLFFEILEIKNGFLDDDAVADNVIISEIVADDMFFVLRVYAIFIRPHRLNLYLSLQNAMANL